MLQESYRIYKNKGLVDFGEDCKNLEVKYFQPVTVFTSRGSVVGTELAKFVFTCTILLAQVGAIVHGFVSDGAQKNRKVVD
ncbi:Hypothetical protein CINCED_3A012167 [Cinara cedri]|uniref:Transposable element P transposase-like RNase H domain-containing protein n=1 Tax=Cinara cedri TaxID=506608 RepID=A0A5E4NJS7_9HEMI|nr:Hypothetical protein CINCED_3A012167 [Cinara cedri]